MSNTSGPASAASLRPSNAATTPGRRAPRPDRRDDTARAREGCAGRPPRTRPPDGGRRRSGRRRAAAARPPRAAAPVPIDARRGATRSPLSRASRAALDDVHVAGAAAQVAAQRVEQLARRRRPGCSSRSAASDITKPGVQKPHCMPCASWKACWTGWSSPRRPGPRRSRSQRRRPARRTSGTSAPARRRRSTVHAPQTPCSQPTCVPVSRSAVADEVAQQQPRLDARAVRSSPLTVSLISNGPASATHRSAPRPRRARRAAVSSRGFPPVARARRAGSSSGSTASETTRLTSSSSESSMLRPPPSPRRPPRDAASALRRTARGERTARGHRRRARRRRHAHEREVAAPAGELHERPAGVRWKRREARLEEHLARLERDAVVRRRRSRPPAPRGCPRTDATTIRRVERDGQGGQLRRAGRGGRGCRTPCRGCAPVDGRCGARPPRGAASSRAPRRSRSSALWRVPAPIASAPSSSRGGSGALHAPQVHQRVGHRQAEVHHRHERLAAGDHVRVPVALANQRQKLVKLLGGVVCKSSGFHQRAKVRN